MLPGDDQLALLVNEMGPLEFSLQLPQPAAEYFAACGELPSIADEQRRYIRRHLRVTAALHYRRSLPELRRVPRWFKVLVRDVHRKGISFLHSEQLFPTEQLTLVLLDGKRRKIEVMRCTRLGDHCYAVGADFVGDFRPDNLPQ